MAKIKISELHSGRSFNELTKQEAEGVVGGNGNAVDQTGLIQDLNTLQTGNGDEVDQTGLLQKDNTIQTR